MLRRVLIANRGEIALRVARACREMGIESVAVYSDADRDAPHVLAADRAVHIGPAPARESYLDVEALLAAARAAEADAVHPGYGFLSENAAFARAVADAGLTFVGPKSDVIAAMGDKTGARALAVEAGIPVAPAAVLEAASDRAAAGAQVGYPLLVKAAGGGGGKGMRVVDGPEGLTDAVDAAQREALGAFGDDRVFLERYFVDPRHIEVQIFADRGGQVVHLGERECSIQRRYQKLIEESPSPFVEPPLRARLTEAAVSLARKVGYENAGTVEFLVTEAGEFYFLEMNTRLQVEHPVTEWVTGIDMVQAQLRIAAGEPLGLRQEDIVASGHAIEGRIYAEDPARGFLPCPAPVTLLRVPEAPWVRFDAGIREGYDVPIHYDPMLAKLSVWGESREAARRRLLGALRDLALLGPQTTVPYLAAVVAHPAFAAGATHTGFLPRHFADWQAPHTRLELAAIAAHLHAEAAAPQRSAGAAAAPTVTAWQTLGGWRLGGPRS